MFEDVRARLQDKKMKKRFLIALVSVVVVVFAVSMAILLVHPASNTTKIDKTSCESSGGTWNECGSPCFGAPQGTMCVQSCRQQCEWYAGNAEVAKDSVYASQPGFSCVTQDNGILMCLLAN